MEKESKIIFYKSLFTKSIKDDRDKKDTGCGTVLLLLKGYKWLKLARSLCCFGPGYRPSKSIYSQKSIKMIEIKKQTKNTGCGTLLLLLKGNQWFELARWLCCFGPGYRPSHFGRCKPNEASVSQTGTTTGVNTDGTVLHVCWGFPTNISTMIYSPDIPF